MCLGDWEAHGSDRYECSRYEEDLNNTKKSDEDQAIEKDYFYVERACILCDLEYYLYFLIFLLPLWYLCTYLKTGLVCLEYLRFDLFSRL